MKFYKKFYLVGVCLFFCQVLIVNAQLGIVDQNAKTKPTLVILGTYHMGTPGNNIVNPKVADISTPERQKEMAELVKKLKNFKPTKIVLECDHPEADAKTQENYGKYLSGNYQLSKNETDQIGFRLAKESGLKKVYCVDWSDFWNDPNINYIKYAAKDPELDNFLKGVNQKLKQETDAEAAKILPLPITDQLIFINQPERMEKDHKVYFDIMRIGRGKEYAGAGYFSWWYRRNLVILTNIIRLTDSMDERIFVVYGAGHNKLLNQLAKESDFYTVESPLKYLKGKK